MGRFKARELRNDATPDEVRRQLNEIQKEIAADLATLSAARRVTELQLGDYTARYGDIVRMAPPGAGARLLLPPVNLAQPNGRVTLVAESVTGAVTAEAIDSTVNGAETIVFGVGRGTAEFVLTGTGWYCSSVDLDIPSGAIPNGKLANMAPGTVKGLQVDAAAPAAPVDLTGAEVGELLRLSHIQDGAGAVGTNNDFPLDVRTKIVRINPGDLGGDVAITGFALNGGGVTANRGGFFLLIKQGAAYTLTLKQADSGSATNNRNELPGFADFVMSEANAATWIQYLGNRWQVAQTPGPKGDPGDGATGITRVILRDDFELIAADVTGSSGGATVIGTLQTSSGNWVVSGTGTVSYVTGESGAPGIVRLSTSSAVGVRIHKGKLASDGFIFGSDVGEFSFRFRTNDTSNIQINLGLVIFPTFPDALLIGYAPSGSANITVFARNTSVDTLYDTGSPPGLSTWNTVRLVQTAPGSVDVYLNGVNVHTISTNIPTAILNFYAEVYSASGSVSADIDVTELVSNVLAR